MKMGQVRCSATSLGLEWTGKAAPLPALSTYKLSQEFHNTKQRRPKPADSSKPFPTLSCTKEYPVFL